MITYFILWFNRVLNLIFFAVVLYVVLFIVFASYMLANGFRSCDVPDRNIDMVFPVKEAVCWLMEDVNDPMSI